MGEVIEINVSTTLPISPEKVLSAAIEHGLATVLLLGRTAEGDFYIASSDGDLGNLMVLTEAAKRELLAQAFA